MTEYAGFYKNFNTGDAVNDKFTGVVMGSDSSVHMISESDEPNGTTGISSTKEPSEYADTHTGPLTVRGEIKVVAQIGGGNGSINVNGSLNTDGFIANFANISGTISAKTILLTGQPGNTALNLNAGNVTNAGAISANSLTLNVDDTGSGYVISNEIGLGYDKIYSSRGGGIKLLENKIIPVVGGSGKSGAHTDGLYELGQANTRFKTIYSTELYLNADDRLTPDGDSSVSETKIILRRDKGEMGDSVDKYGAEILGILSNDKTNPHNDRFGINILQGTNTSRALTIDKDNHITINKSLKINNGLTIGDGDGANYSQYSIYRPGACGIQISTSSIVGTDGIGFGSNGTVDLGINGTRFRQLHLKERIELKPNDNNNDDYFYVNNTLDVGVKRSSTIWNINSSGDFTTSGTLYPQNVDLGNLTLTTGSEHIKITNGTNYFYVNDTLNVGIKSTQGSTKSWLILNNGDFRTNGTITISNDSGLNSGFGWTVTSRTLTGPFSASYRLEFSFNGQKKGYISNTEVSNTTDGDLMNFTGQHRSTSLNSSLYSNDYIGYIVCASGQFKKLNSKCQNTADNIEINESLPYVDLTSTECDKSVFGVISNKEDPDNTSREYESGAFVSVAPQDKGDARLIVNSLGEGAIWVSDFNGPLHNGDYITTSAIPGIGMKQSSDQLMNYTVAKITMSCDFIPKLEPRMVLKTTTVLKQRQAVTVTKTTKTETKVEYDEGSGRYVQKTIEVETENKEEQVTEVDLYDESGAVVGKHTIPLLEEYEDTEYETDANGNPVYVPELDEQGNTIMQYEYKMKYIKLDGTLLSEQEYTTAKSSGQPVYKMAFVGCTYHCG